MGKHVSTKQIHMRIAIMLRAYDRPGGIGIYSRNIVKHLLRLDHDNQYVLLYNNPEHLGTYGDLDNVDEVCIPAANQLIWDQWLVPRELKKWNVDLVFNTKFSVPFFTRRKRVMVLHGSSWFTHPELYKPLDILYVRIFMPLYLRAADFLISNSGLTTRDFQAIYKILDRKIETVHLAPGEAFRPIENKDVLVEIARKYNLPDRFILTVTSYDPRKNFRTLLEAFKLCRRHSPIDLVVVGKDCYNYARDYGFAGQELATTVHFPGWIVQEDLPAIYSLAEVYVFPSIYEEFGIPVVEAMACGCPVVSSSTGAIPELVGNAALLCDPFDHEALAANIGQMLNTAETREECRRRGLEQARAFSWDIAAEKTREIFTSVMK